MMENLEHFQKLAEFRAPKMSTTLLKTSKKNVSVQLKPIRLDMRSPLHWFARADKEKTDDNSEKFPVKSLN